MEFEDALKQLKDKKSGFNGMTNKNWNGLKTPGKQMHVTIQWPDMHSKNTEPYLMFHSGISIDGVFHFKRFPWTPSALDLFSDQWEVHK